MAAGAHDGGVGAYPDVADVAGRAAPPVQAAVDDHAAADAGAGLEHHEVVAAGPARGPRRRPGGWRRSRRGSAGRSARRGARRRGSCSSRACARGTPRAAGGVHGTGDAGADPAQGTPGGPWASSSSSKAAAIQSRVASGPSAMSQGRSSTTSGVPLRSSRPSRAWCAPEVGHREHPGGGADPQPPWPPAAARGARALLDEQARCRSAPRPAARRWTRPGRTGGPARRATRRGRWRRGAADRPVPPARAASLCLTWTRGIPRLYLLRQSVDLHRNHPLRSALSSISKEDAMTQADHKGWWARWCP